MIPRLTELAAVDAQARAFARALKGAGFAGEVASDAASRVVGSTDNSIYQILPRLLVYPRSAADVELLFRVASRPEFASLTFTARGGGTGTNGQSLTSGVIVDLGRHLRAIEEPVLTPGASDMAGSGRR